MRPRSRARARRYHHNIEMPVLTKKNKTELVDLLIKEGT